MFDFVLFTKLARHANAHRKGKPSVGKTSLVRFACTRAYWLPGSRSRTFPRTIKRGRRVTRDTADGVNENNNNNNSGRRRKKSTKISKKSTSERDADGRTSDNSKRENLAVNGTKREQWRWSVNRAKPPGPRARCSNNRNGNYADTERILRWTGHRCEGTREKASRKHVPGHVIHAIIMSRTPAGRSLSRA